VTKFVYLCGPINGCTDGEATDWREQFKERWEGQTLDPMRRDYRGLEKALYREVVELDKIDVRNSDIVLVNYSKPSVGTSMEMFYAHQLGKPVVLWCAMGANLSPWLMYHATIIVHDIDNAVSSCRKILK